MWEWCDEMKSQETYTTSHLEKSGTEYDSKIFSGGLDKFMALKEAEILRSMRLSGQSYLDFATGSGRILEVLAPQFDEVVALDVSEAMVSSARKKVPEAQFHIGGLRELHKRKFDLITAFRFFGNAEMSLREEILGDLRPLVGGLMIVNNHRNPDSRLCSGSKGLDLNHSNFVNLLEKHKYNIVKCIPIGAWMVKYTWVDEKVWRRLNWLESICERMPLSKWAPDTVYIVR